MCASDFVKQCYRKKPVREWEKQEREGEETKQMRDLRQRVVQLDPAGKKVMRQVCPETRERGLSYIYMPQLLTKRHSWTHQFIKAKPPVA